MRAWMLAILTGLMLLSSAALAQPEFEDPAALVAYAYAPYSTGTFPDEMTELFSPTLKQLWDDMVARSQEMPIIDFDPFINAQDYELSELVIADPAVEGDRATVAASFLNFGEPHEMRFTLVRRAEGWKIDDIESIGGDYPWRLSELLAADPMLN